MHHPIFAAFRPTATVVPPGYTLDSFLGSIRREDIDRVSTRPQADSDPTSSEAEYPPRFDEEYLEWVDVLESTAAARGSYVFIELGDGYGRWSARAAKAARQLGIEELHIIAVEADPTHFGWLPEHLEANGIGPNTDLIQAAVNDSVEPVPFVVGMPPELGRDEPDEWYGQSIYWGVPRKGLGRFAQAVRDLVSGHPRPRLDDRLTLRDEQGWTFVMVPSVTLTELLSPLSTVDLIDMDIQGAEAKVVRESIQALSDRVRRVHIATHSADLEEIVRNDFQSAGWRCLADFPGATNVKTAYGASYFGDGVQSWLNPRLAPFHRR